MNDKASSIRVPQGFQVRIVDGGSTTGWASPGFYNLTDWGWNDRADGFQAVLTDAGRSEYYNAKAGFDQAVLNLQKVATSKSELAD
jgi:hypothetical protein